MFLYRAFGLTLASELACPELLAGDAVPDIEIRFADEDARTASGESASGFQATAGHYELRVPKVARFVVSDGRSITIDRHADADDDSIRLFLLGSAIGALLHQRAVLPLHGSAVCKNDRSVLILGASGAGKSSLAAALGRYGWRLQSDDICALRLDGGRVWCDAGFPRQKMWPDSLKMLGETAEQHDRVRPNLEKRNRRVSNNDFHDGRSLVETIVALRHHRQPDPRIATIDGPPGMAVLKRQIFRAQLSTRLEVHLQHFTMIAALAAQARLLRLHRPLAGGSPVSLAEFLVPHFESAFAETR